MRDRKQGSIHDGYIFAGLGEKHTPLPIQTLSRGEPHSEVNIKSPATLRTFHVFHDSGSTGSGGHDYGNQRAAPSVTVRYHLLVRPSHGTAAGCREYRMDDQWDYTHDVGDFFRDSRGSLYL